MWNFIFSNLEINILWAAHQVHHSAEDYNLTTAFRQSMIMKFANWPFYLPMAFFVPPSQMIIHVQFNLLYQFWIHTELVKDLGPLEYILNTAKHHRVHHGNSVKLQKSEILTSFSYIIPENFVKKIQNVFLATKFFQSKISKLTSSVNQISFS